MRSESRRKDTSLDKGVGLSQTRDLPARKCRYRSDLWVSNRRWAYSIEIVTLLRVFSP